MAGRTGLSGDTRVINTSAFKRGRVMTRTALRGGRDVIGGFARRRLAVMALGTGFG